MPLTRSLYFILILLQTTCWVGLSSTALAQEITIEELSVYNKQVEIIEEMLKRKKAHENQVKLWIKQLPVIRSRAAACELHTNENLEKIKADLDILGEPMEWDAPEVIQQRQFLQDKKLKQAKLQASCRLLILRSDDAIRIATELQAELLAAELFVRGPGPMELVRANLAQPDLWFTATWEFLTRHSGFDKLTISQHVALFLLTFAGLSLGWRLRQKVYTYLHAQKPAMRFSVRFIRANLSVFGYYLPHLLTTSIIALYLFLIFGAVKPLPFISIVAYGLPVLFLLVSVIQLFLHPRPPAQFYLPIPTEVSKAIAKRLQILVLLLFIGYLLFITLLAQSLPEHPLLLARSIFAAVLVLNLIWVVWLLGRIPNFPSVIGPRISLSLIFIGILIAELMGYRNLSQFVLLAILGSIFAYGIAWVINSLLRELFDGLDEGRHRWQRWIHRLMGLEASEHIPGMTWMRFISSTILWLTFGLVILQIWGLSETGMQKIHSFTVDGFTVGSLKIIPEKIILGLAALAILLTFNSWLKRALERSWLPKTRMDRGAREAMVTMSGYTGTAVSALIALSIAGMEFGNLAIIAGALSVGIGFGLQNIVNNFVSGLILLFERPVKTGDWIVTGSTEGYVKKISIRSTQIETFDKADVIVPNSELISAQVTNWMLYDVQGRIRVPVGVAYGSDTQLVKKLLLQVAQDHKMVITRKKELQPAVLFLGFGDSSLNFELRCFIKNIDRRLGVMSDLNFAIDAAFREHGVEIPFPQRDLHVRSWRKEAADDSQPPKPPEADDGA